MPTEQFDHPLGRLLAVLGDQLFFDTEAARIDRDGGLPDPAMNRLRDAGLLKAPLPPDLGGSGIGTVPLAADDALLLLRRMGRADLSLGRLFEGHLNAIRLVLRYGHPAQHDAMASRVRKGALIGLWVTDEVPVRLLPAGAGWRLEGEKSIASGVGLADAALITVQPPDGLARMALVPVGGASDGAGAGLSRVSLAGMRGAATGRHDFTGTLLSDAELIGSAGDYLRQPEFSAGAWRGSAVALGGIDRLLDLLRQSLAARGRDADPHQRARVGEALIQRETGALWCRRAALLAEGESFRPGDVQATVNLARIACEQAGLRVMTLVQRGLGLQCFVRGTQVERVMRDLATYLRQPAADECLCEAAGWFMDHDMPAPECDASEASAR